MTLINVDMVNAQLVEDQAVIFLLLGQQVLQTLFAPGFLFFERFDDVTVGAGGVSGSAVTQELVIGGDLRTEKALLKRLGHANALEGAVRGDNTIPGATGDSSREELAALPREIL